MNMKNISWTQINIILVIAISTVVLLCIFGGIFYQTDRMLVQMDDVMEMNDAWIIETNEDYDSATDLPCKLEVTKGEPISISHFLPDKLGADYGIAFRSVYNQVQVKVGDRILYQYGVEERQPFVSSPVPNWNFVPIDSQYAGELLTITQVSNYGAYSGLFPSVEISSRSALLYRQWLRYGWGILLSVVLLCLTIGLGIIAVRIRRQRKLDLRFRYYLLLEGAMLLFSISGSPLLSIYLKNGFLFWLMHILLRMLIPILYLVFLRGFVQNKRLILAVDLGIIDAGIIYIVAVVLQMMGLLEFPFTYQTLEVIYGLSFLVITAGITIGWLKYKRKELRSVSVANLFLSAAGIGNLFLRPNHLYQIESTFWQVSVMLYLFLLLGAVVEVLLKQMEERIQETEAAYSGQRSMAVSMMNPNFLFAALNSLLTMTKTKSGNSAKFVFAFSKYLRYNLDSVREDRIIPFLEELEHISAYLEIQQLRMPELKITIEDKMHDFQVPARSIEAIVENAVKHGIGKKENRGQVIIRSYERRDAYAIQIVDDGIGFDTDMLYRKNTPTSMKTVRERLEQSTGAVLEVKSRLDKGTIVTVKLPKNNRQERQLSQDS